MDVARDAVRLAAAAGVHTGGRGPGGPAGSSTARWSAADHRDGTPAQLVLPGPLRSDGTRRTFDHRLAAVAGRAVPGTVRVRRGGRDGDHPWLVVDDVQGRPLPELLAATGAQGASALYLLRPLAEALDGLHANGVVHRDVCADAVVLDPRGGPLWWFTDLLRIPDADRTETGDVAGVEVHRAPEASSGRSGHRADVYAFGCLAFRMVTGRPAFTVATLADRAAGRMPPVHALPAQVAAVFAAVLAVDPIDRPPSATAFVGDLERAFGDRYRPRASARLVLAVRIAAVVAALACAAAVASGAAAAASAGDAGTDPVTGMSAGR